VGVIPYRRTGLADPGRAWDGDAERARAEVSDLRVMCAWVKEPGDTKDDYKLPHHTAQGHLCVLAGVRSALHLLGATHLPEGDRGGVEAHLRRHLRDFGVDDESEERQQQHAGAVGPMHKAQGAVAPMRVKLQGGVERRASARVYEVVVMTPGDGNGLVYPSLVLDAGAPLFEGASVFVDHSQLGELFSMTGGRSLRNVLGVLEGSYFDGGGVKGVLRVYPGPDAEWFTAMVDQHLIDVAEGRGSPRIGLSAVLDVLTRGGEVVSIEKVVSVDAVFDPARGGQFIRALNQRREGGMPPESGLDGNVGHGAPVASGQLGLPESERPNAGQEAPLAGGSSGQGGAGSEAAVSAQQSSSQQPPAQQPADAAPVAATAAAAVALSEQVLDLRLASLSLPDPIKALLRSRFGGYVYRPADLQGEIEALQSAWAASIAAHGAQVQGVGPRPAVSGVVSELDRLQAAMDQLCGLRPASEALQGMPRVSGIRELYLMLSGDYDFRGEFNRERVGLANVTTSTMTSLVKNAFNKVILDYFNNVDRWWKAIVSQEMFGSMQDVTLITLGGFADLDTVAEGAAYTEKSWSDSEEVVSFVKKGNYVGITLEMMDKDETRGFRAIPRKLAIAGYRTLSAAISALFTDNSGIGPYWPSSQSTYYVFDAQYSNLGSSALTPAAWDAVIQAMYKQTEATSAERMGIRPAFLVVPIELEKTALTIMDSMREPGTADNDANVRRGSARVVVCPEWTDTGDWAAVADPRVWPGITVGFRFGAVPEVFVADAEVVGSMFTNDEMRVKVRYIFAVGVGDNRPLYKQNPS
jgi:hypothetical protein